MRVLSNLIVFLIQSTLTLFLLLFIYMILVLIDYEGGFDGFVATTVVQPILGLFFALVTIGICLLIGLPIRISQPINSWWRKNYWIGIVSLFIGTSLLGASLYFTEMYRETDIEKEIPNITLATSGWFITAFSVLHIFPPENVAVRSRAFLTRLFN